MERGPVIDIVQQYEYFGRRPLKERLLSKAIQSSGCWEWSGSTHKDGYGYLNVIVYEGYRRPIGVHRLSYAVFIGPIDDEKLVCHSCDNPLCINPKHLFLGTAADNSADAKSKNRYPRGEKHYARKISFRDVETIRKIRDSVTRRELAQRFGLSKGHIDKILANKKWKV